jgi:Acyl-CoA synthetases (AMP-forming)/AMP-acid ligases II
MPGYWRNPEASAIALRGGWLHTGDIGAFDTEGYLTLKDRSKDLIISGGSNIYPREVEEVLRQTRQSARSFGNRPARQRMG